MYVVGNPKMFSKVTANADNPLPRGEALAGAAVVAKNGGWRVWVERASDPTNRIFESDAEKAHQAAVAGEVGEPADGEIPDRAAFSRPRG